MNHVEGSFNRSLSPEEVDSTGILSARVRLKGNRCPTGAAACKGKSAGLLVFQRETCFDILMARVSGRSRWNGDKYSLPPCVIAGQDGGAPRLGASGQVPSPPRGVLSGSGQKGRKAVGVTVWRAWETEGEMEMERKNFRLSHHSFNW